MKTKNKDNTSSLWTWNNDKRDKKRNAKQFPVTEFLQDNYTNLEHVVMGPGGGAGIGCGVGVGFGLVGGVGFGGWPWNHLKLAFGVGVGCGVGLGFGYGRGLGHGFTLDSLEDYMSKKGKLSKKKGTVLDY